MGFGTKSDRDVKAYKNRLRSVLKSHLRDTLKNEPVISNRRAIVKIPERSTTLPTPSAPLPHEPLRHSMGRPRPAGQTRPGDLIQRVPRNSGGQGGGSQGGSETGSHVIEVWMSEDDLWELIKEEWHLPDLIPRDNGQTPQEEPRWDQRSMTGPPSRLLRRRTIREAVKHGHVIHNDDRRYRQPRYEPVPTTQAVVYLIRDVSGSMMDEKITIWIRTMAFVLTLWLHQQYPHVAIEFLAYEAEAKVVSEAEFFGMSGGGGTIVNKALSLIEDLQLRQYPPADWQQYAYCWTDGGDFDPEGAMHWLETHISTFTQFGWIQTDIFRSTWSGLFQQLDAWVDHHGSDVVRLASLHSDQEVAQCLQTLFSSPTATATNGN